MILFDTSSLDLFTISSVIVPPLAGTIIGYFTNDIAIKMLFRPYKAIYIGKFRLPFTPGLIPRNQKRLAKKVSDTIMGSLLTPEELQKLVGRLLKAERAKIAILWLLNLAIQQIKEDKQQKTAKILSEILRNLFNESLPRLLELLARRQDLLEDQINQIFDKIILDFQFSDNQANQFADWLLEKVASPNTLRETLIEFLSEKNIQTIDEGIKEKTSGSYWFIANFFGVSDTLLKLKNFCLEEKEVANARLEELLLSLEIRNQLKEWLKNFSLRNLPVSTIKELRKTNRETIQKYIQKSGTRFIQDFGTTVNWEQLSILIINRIQNSTMLNTSLETVSQELALVLEKYLEKNLETIVLQTIPIMSIDQIIIDRIKATSSKNLEIAVQGIVQNELQAIVNLGGVLGFIVGVFQTFIILLK
ncbi:DUF445 domain-containing protein [Candidatus Atelocyanobacterium thalassae]|uniref:Uncharacterized protein n=2 Tax=Candidatus Atelocyanobacterium thalassae TaxID=713887 RepID=A0A086CHS0_9CHRO|nr:DUF445 family protein [Candidatus Atelocyanobacterium thalassa]KFF41734.1 MAG: hypothetical protein ucyna2_00358 [Candidatus Atelocyanobacterium thalassa isolate SIO64986]BDA39470.1 hypothetical protein CPARK_000030900 [cyanobacterium endosymbiont of Braarudosphaera bigelowii]